MANRTTNSMTPDRTRKAPRTITNTQSALPAYGDYDSDESNYDENFPIIHDVRLHQHQFREPLNQSLHQMRKDSNFSTSQLKRKRQGEHTTRSATDTFQDYVIHKFDEQMKTLQLMMKEVDCMHKKEEVLGKKIYGLDKIIDHIIAKINKNPTPCEPSTLLPVIEYEGLNLLTEPTPRTPIDLMKYWINQLFTPNEILHGKHQETNERTDKIKAATGDAYFNSDPHKIRGFWDNAGKITRGNQKRGYVFRHRNQRQAIILTAPVDHNHEPNGDAKDEQNASKGNVGDTDHF